MVAAAVIEHVNWRKVAEAWAYRLGVEVFPVRGKIPAGGHSHTQAALGRPGVQLSPNGWAVATGFGCMFPKGSHGAIIEYDYRPAGDNLLKAAPTLARTFAVKSGSGRGVHWYVNAPGLNMASIKAPDGTEGASIRRYGKYAVGPGSNHPDGGIYQVLRNAAVIELPAQEIEALNALFADGKKRAPIPLEKKAKSAVHTSGELEDQIKARLSCFDFMRSWKGEPAQVAAGGGFWLAPHRSERTPSFFAYEGERGFYDFGGDHWGGDVIHLIAFREGLDCSNKADYPRILEIAAQAAGLEYQAVQSARPPVIQAEFQRRGETSDQGENLAVENFDSLATFPVNEAWFHAARHCGAGLVYFVAKALGATRFTSSGLKQCAAQRWGWTLELRTIQREISRGLDVGLLREAKTTDSVTRFSLPEGGEIDGIQVTDFVVLESPRAKVFEFAPEGEAQASMLAPVKRRIWEGRCLYSDVLMALALADMQVIGQPEALTTSRGYNSVLADEIEADRPQWARMVKAAQAQFYNLEAALGRPGGSMELPRVIDNETGEIKPWQVGDARDILAGLYRRIVEKNPGRAFSQRELEARLFVWRSLLPALRCRAGLTNQERVIEVQARTLNEMTAQARAAGGFIRAVETRDPNSVVPVTVRSPSDPRNVEGRRAIAAAVEKGQLLTGRVQLASVPQVAGPQPDPVNRLLARQKQRDEQTAAEIARIFPLEGQKGSDEDMAKKPNIQKAPRVQRERLYFPKPPVKVDRKPGQPSVQYVERQVWLACQRLGIEIQPDWSVNDAVNAIVALDKGRGESQQV